MNTNNSISRCKCCLEEKNLKDMWKEYYSEGEKEIYGVMIRDCFIVPWDPPLDKLEFICESCIINVRLATSFKKRMLVSEQMLSDCFNYATALILKQEDSDVDIETEYLSIEYLEEDSVDGVKKEIKIENQCNTDQCYKKEKYTQDDLNKCLEAVQSKTLTQVKASIIYNIPRKTISEALSILGHPPRKSGRQRDPELMKSQENLDIILDNTNITPFSTCGVRGFECFFCSQTYSKPWDLKTHTTMEHAGKKMYKVYCSSEKSVKLDVTGLKCNICKEDVRFEDILKHLKENHNENVHSDAYNILVPFKFDDDSLKCYVCNEKFISFKLLNNHVNIMHFKNYECEKCGRGFINRKSLQTHMNRHITGTYACSHCEKVFTTRIRQTDHERSVHRLNNMRNRCAFCGQRFNDLVKKKEHEVSMHNAPKTKYECNACSKTYDSQRSLQRHVQSFHLMIRPHTCDECGSAFYKSMDLNKHMVKHTGERKFSCDVCSKTYGRKNTLREHMRIHANDRRFKCECCGQSFIQKCSLRGHMLAKHGQFL